MDSTQLRKLVFNICGYTDKETSNIMKFMKDNKIKFVANKKKATAIITRRPDPNETKLQINFDDFCQKLNNI